MDQTRANEWADYHAKVAEGLLGKIKTDKKGYNVAESGAANVATAHAALALYYQREGQRA
jgi:hypothetical protein